MELDFEIFLQYVWCGLPNNRAITKALIFDVDVQQWNQALNFFRDHKFDQNYAFVSFLALMQHKNIEEDVLAFFRTHNKDMHETVKMPITRQLDEAGKTELKTVD